MEPRRARGGCSLSPVQNLLATVGELGMASQTPNFSLLERGLQIGVMVVMRLGFRYGERLSISRGDVVSARVFGFLKDEMDVHMALSSFLALGQYYLPEGWIPDWIIYHFGYHYGLVTALRLVSIFMEGQELGVVGLVGAHDAVAADIVGQHGEHFSLLRIVRIVMAVMRLGLLRRIGIMAVMRLVFRYGERLSISRGNMVSAMVFGFLKIEMDVHMTLSSFLALGQYYLPEGWIPDWIIYFVSHYFGLLTAIRLTAIFTEGQDVAADVGGQDAVAAVIGVHDHEIVNAH